jgi:para-nitrobenzyl esterase
MVYVHGGGFNAGCGLGQDGSNLAAEQNVVVVTMDYRLGPLGFLSLPALRSEDPSYPSSGNYGLSDQIAALQWVQQNAAAFGGDPANVTIFGESAGGISMYVHLTSPKSSGLFQRVIVSEGYSNAGQGLPNVFASTEAMADQNSASFVAATPCAGSSQPLTCLRGASVLSLVDADGAAGLPWPPVVDNFLLPADPATLLAEGTFNKVPIVFQVANQASNSDAHVQYLSCPTLSSALDCASAGVPTFVADLTYAFNTPGVPNVPFDGEQTLFVFDEAAAWGISFTPQEQLLGQQMRAYWASMAATGNPNGGGRFPWPAFNLTTEQDLVLDTTLSTEAALGVGPSCGLHPVDGGASDAANE